MRRGEIWWASLGEPSGSEPGFRRPIVIVSANILNDSRLKTVVTVPITGNLTHEHFAGYVRLPTQGTGLSKASVALVSLVGSTNRLLLTERIGRVPDRLMAEIDSGLRLVLAL